MNNELLLSIKEQTDTLIEQSKTEPQETFEFKLNKQMEIFPYSPPINFSEEGKWFLAVTSFEATNSVLNITNENNSFSTTTTSIWNSKSAEKFIGKLCNLLELKSQPDIELHDEQIGNKGL